MKRNFVLTVLTFVFVALLGAQAYTEVKWPAKTSTGSTAVFNVAGNDAHTLSVVVTGSPSACTMNLDGSLDGTNFFNLSGDITCTSSVMFHVINRPVTLVRATVSALSGGSSPTVTVRYIGFRTGGRQ